MINQTDLHGIRPPPAPGQRKMNLCKRTRIAVWNVQTLLRPGHAALLSRELSQYNIALAGLCETRWRGTGETSAGDHFFIWSGPDNNSGLYGVALAIPLRIKRTLIAWTPINDRLLTARLSHQHGKITVIVAYSPTEVAEDQTKDAFYDQLLDAILAAPPHDIVIVLTDANATISVDPRHTIRPAITGPVHVDTITNNNGDRLLHLCRSTNLCISDTWFPRKRIHHWTWYSPDGKTKKAIDHILISARWKSSVTNCRVFRGAQLGNTDHRMLIANLRLKLKATTPAKRIQKLDSSRFQDPAIKESYSCAISNRFSALDGESLTDWSLFKSEVVQAAFDTIGQQHQSPKKPWISQETLDIINHRRAARLRGDLDEYRRLNCHRNMSIRRDREKFWSDQASILEKASRHNNKRLIFKLLRQAKSGPRHRCCLVKDTSGNILSDELKCIGRWKEHFSQLLNHPPVPEDPTLNSISAVPNPDCDLSPVTPAEVKFALQKIKNNKAPGICSITAEMLKAGGNNLILWLTQIINHVWVLETLPDD